MENYCIQLFWNLFNWIGNVFFKRHFGLRFEAVPFSKLICYCNYFFDNFTRKIFFFINAFFVMCVYICTLTFSYFMKSCIKLFQFSFLHKNLINRYLTLISWWLLQHDKIKSHIYIFYYSKIIRENFCGYLNFFI